MDGGGEVMRCELGGGIVKICIKWPRKINDSDDASFKSEQFIPE